MQFIKHILVWILTLESRLILRRYKPFIVALTCSFGKTSNKDSIYEVLRGKNVCDDQHLCYVRKSDKSMNSEIGLPLTIIGVPNAWRSLGGWFDNVTAGLNLIFRLKKGSYPDCLVLEVGADHPADIKRVAKWLRPHIAVVTRVSRTPVHVEFFDSPEQVFEEKMSLVEAVRDGGTAVVFAEDGKMMSAAEKVKSRGVSVVSFGLNETASVKAGDFSILYENGAPSGISFVLKIGDSSAPVTVKGILGQTYVYPLLAAAAVGTARGISAASIAGSLSAFDAPRGRMKIVPGLHGSVVIDDTYNSSPDAASAALSSLKSVQCTGSKIAVLADMMELGKYAGEEHRKIGREAAASADKLYTVGPRSKMTAEEAVKAGMPPATVRSFDSSAEAAEAIAPAVAPGDVILVKGSQSMRMERVSKALLAAPERAGELLVRQEREWLEKA